MALPPVLPVCNHRELTVGAERKNRPLGAWPLCLCFLPSRGLWLHVSGGVLRSSAMLRATCWIVRGPSGAGLAIETSLTTFALKWVLVGSRALVA